MNCRMCKHRESFIFGKHHQGDPKPTPIASDLQDVVCVFKLLTQLLHSLAPHHRAAVLKSRNFIELKQSYLQRYSAYFVAQLAQSFRNRLVMPATLF
jgi:hypothetical protein